MKKIYRKYIDEAIKNNYDSKTCQDLIFKDVIFDSCFRFMFILLFLIYSFLNQEILVKITNISADTILNHEVLINSAAFYFTWIIILLIILFIANILATILLKCLKKINLKKIYRYYKIYDLLKFICSIWVIINFIIVYVITPVTIDGISMEDSYYNNDKVLLWHFGYKADSNDVVVIDASNYGDSSSFYIKRIVAIPGDKLDYSENVLYVNDKLVCQKLTISEWNIIINSVGFSNCEQIIIPENKYLLLGDNRNHSSDSRYFGLVDQKDIIGKIILRYYPFNRFGIPKSLIKQ